MIAAKRIHQARMAKSVLIIGGGLAGLATAVALAPRGYRVTLLESRDRLGGRATSFQDQQSGQLVDACQHVSMGCCTQLADFCRTVGIDHLLEPLPCFYFLTPDRRRSRFGADPLPAPFHLLRSFLGAHYLSPSEKLRVAWGLACLKRTPIDIDPPFQQWLQRHGQTPRIIDRFWGVVLTSALNETPERIGLKYARKVFLDGFLTDRRGFQVELPTVPLGRLYGEELLGWLDRHGVDLRLNQGVKRIDIEGGEVARLALRQGDELTADWYVSAVPWYRLLDLLPTDVIDRHPTFGHLCRLETSPITSVHFWFDRPAFPLPHSVLLDTISQWVFNRGEVAPGEYYLQVVISAARQYRALGNEEIKRRVRAELENVHPPLREAVLRRGRVVTEHQATFSAVPGVDRHRPAQQSPIGNLLVAGDWTATGWPATMEGAVRSGNLAAAAITTSGGASRRTTSRKTPVSAREIDGRPR
jgi:squalene-associated FAD-dependent desaturase